MNAKKAKGLRKQAQEMTVGMPERQLVQLKRGGAGNNPFSTRGVYQKLKGRKGIDVSQVVIAKEPPKRNEVAQATAGIPRAPVVAPTTRKGLLAALAGLAASVKTKVLSL